jgi:MFS family permease
MQRIGQSWLVLELTGNSGFVLGITTALQYLPWIVVGPWAGVLADRFPKRRILMITGLGMGVTAGVLGGLVVAGVVELWHVLLLALLLGIFGAVEIPVRHAFVAETVDPVLMPNAIGLSSATKNLGQMIGPGLAGGLIVVLGTGPVFLGNALSFGAVMIALWSIRADELLLAEGVQRRGGQLRAGVSYAWNRPDLVLVLAVTFVVGAFAVHFQMTSALMATTVFEQGAAEFGLLGSALAVGSLAGAVLAARFREIRLRRVVTTALCLGAVQLAAGLAPSYELYLVSLLPLGVLWMIWTAAARGALLIGSDTVFRGRVLALYSATLGSGATVGAFLGGAVGESFGARWILIAGCLSCIIVPSISAGLFIRYGRRRSPSGFPG